MGQKLSLDDQELYRRCDEVIHSLWDPIGISNAPEARDEYYSYLPRIFALVKAEAAKEELVEHLLQIERELIGLGGDEIRAKAVAETLLEWRDWISKRPL